MTKKKSRSFIPAIVILVLAVLAAAGVKTFLGPCVHEDGTFGPCHAAALCLFPFTRLSKADPGIVLRGN